MYSPDQILQHLKTHPQLANSALLCDDGGSASHVVIDGLASVHTADPKKVICVFEPALFKQLVDTKAAMVVLPKDAANVYTGMKILCDNPYLAYAQLTGLFVVASQAASIHPTAVIHETAVLGEHVSVGAYSVIGANVTLEDHVVIGETVTVANDVTIERHTRVFPRVSIYANTKVGAHCNIHSGAVLGSDGFGFAPQQGTPAWKKIEQLGRVVIGAYVEIGANTTIDRGALDDTIIGSGVIIDNQVQIAHNVRIGDNTAIAGCVGIAGSSVIGQHCRLAGGVGIAGHITIVDNVTITAMSMVTRSIREPGSYSCGTPLQPTQQWRKNAVRFGQLDNWFRKKTK